MHTARYLAHADYNMTCRLLDAALTKDDDGLMMMRRPEPIRMQIPDARRRGVIEEFWENFKRVGTRSSTWKAVAHTTFVKFTVSIMAFSMTIALFFTAFLFLSYPAWDPVCTEDRPDTNGCWDKNDKAYPYYSGWSTGEYVAAGGVLLYIAIVASNMMAAAQGGLSIAFGRDANDLPRRATVVPVMPQQQPYPPQNNGMMGPYYMPPKMATPAPNQPQQVAPAQAQAQAQTAPAPAPVQHQQLYPAAPVPVHNAPMSSEPSQPVVRQQANLYEDQNNPFGVEMQEKDVRN